LDERDELLLLIEDEVFTEELELELEPLELPPPGVLEQAIRIKNTVNNEKIN
jgi:hypothetical protein